ncbi:MAG: hypothetical protein J1E39_02670 [Eubacterium sp.]|nr:hypothetical protein [Eubacterium sp.]
MTKTKLKLSPICAAASALILLILRTVQLTVAVEYPSGFYLPSGGAINIVYTVLMIIAAAAVAYTAYLDCKPLRGRKLELLPTKPASVYGIAVIIYGAAMASYALAQLSAEIGFYGIVCMIGALSAVGLGMLILANGKIRPMCCIPVVLMIISFIIKCIFFFISNPIITGIPQKLMVMMIYVLSVLFWINMGRLISDGEKKLTRTAATASGLALGCAWLAYVGSSFLLMLTDGEKWLLLDDTPDLELIVIGAIPAVLTLILLFCSKPVKARRPARPSSERAAAPVGADRPARKRPQPAQRKAAEEKAVKQEVVQENSKPEIPKPEQEDAVTVEEPKQEIPVSVSEPETPASAAEPELPAPAEKPEAKEYDKYDIDAIIEQYTKK